MPMPMKAATEPVTAPVLPYRCEATKIQNRGTPNPIRTAPTSVNAVEPVPTRALLIAAITATPPVRAPLRRSRFRLAGGFGGEVAKVSVGVDAPLGADLGQLRRHGPAVGALGALVIRGGSLEGHAARVVADRPDLGHVGGAEALLVRKCGQLGALVLDRTRSLARLLNQSWDHAGNRLVGEVPLAGQVHRGQVRALGD